MNRFHAALIRLNCTWQRRRRGAVQTCTFADTADSAYAVIKADGIGDFVLATAFLNVMDRKFQRARITLFCNNLVHDLAKKLYPRWDVVSVRRNAHSGVGVWPSKPNAYRKLVKRPAVDALFDLRGWRNCQDVAWTSWIPARWKLAVQNRAAQGSLSERRESSVYDELVAPASSASSLEWCQDLRNYQALAERLFHSPQECPEVRPSIRRLPSGCFPESVRMESGRYLAVSPFAGANIRRIPDALILESLRRYLSTRETPMPVCLVGGPGDFQESRLLARRISEFVECVNLSGKLSITQTAALIQQASLFLGAESGMAHIAAASGVPSVVVIGGGHWGLFAPWLCGEKHVRWVTHRLPCFHCNWSCIFDEPKCIREISAIELVESMKSLSPEPLSQ
jgi:ADP-heptose:LPS heptosyltransferase